MENENKDVINSTPQIDESDINDIDNISKSDMDPDVLLFADPTNTETVDPSKIDINHTPNKENQIPFNNQIPYQGASPNSTHMTNDMKNKKKAQKNKEPNPFKKTIAKTIILCMVVSAAAGFGGGYFGNLISKKESGSDTEVLYQSVVRTSTDSVSDKTALSVADIASIASDSVVAITTETLATNNRMQQYVTQGAGSGVIITTSGYVATNNHVITNANKINVTLNNGTSYVAALVGVDQKTDIAIIKIDANDLTPVVMGDSESLMVGELAVAIGNPLGQLGGTVTSGIISALDREITIDSETMTLLQTNAAINPGNSGGGLFNAQGELIGIVNAKSSGTGVEGLGFAIPINTIKPIIEQIMSYGYVKGRVTLGVSLLDITDLQTAALYKETTFGVYVVKVEKGSNAENAGILKGDYILTINDTQITTSANVKSALSNISVGDTAKIVILRSGKQMTLSVVMAESQQ